MAAVLFYISLAVVAVVVLVLVVYLLGIIFALRHAGSNLQQLAGGLQTIAGHTQPLPEKVETINGALGQLLAGLVAVDGDLASVARLFRREG